MWAAAVERSKSTTAISLAAALPTISVTDIANQRRTMQPNHATTPALWIGTAEPTGSFRDFQRVQYVPPTVGSKPIELQYRTGTFQVDPRTSWQVIETLQKQQRVDQPGGSTAEILKALCADGMVKCAEGKPVEMLSPEASSELLARKQAEGLARRLPPEDLRKLLDEQIWRSSWR